jgi:CelD/BcsL family acetyltransferase involved in cellulose biosynthesis
MMQRIDLAELFDEAEVQHSRSFNWAQLCVTNQLADFAHLWPRSDRLGAATCYVFQCADVLEIWRDTIGVARNSQNLFSAVLSDLGPLMLLPLGIERRWRTRVLTFLDGGVCDYNAPVVFPAASLLTSGMIRSIWRGLLRLAPPFDVAVFEKMPGDICGAPNPLMKLGVTSYSRSGYLMTLNGTWEQYGAKRLPNRQDSRRQRRRLAELGRVEFAIAKTKADCEEMLAAMMRQKSRRYLETRGVDGFDHPGCRHYYTEMTKRLGPHGPLHLSALRVNREIVATHWGLVADKRFYFLMPAYEGGNWSRYSPGRLLMEQLIEWCFGHGIKIFDFGIGDEPYKIKFHDQVLALHQCFLPVTVKGRGHVIALRAVRRIKDSKIGLMLKWLISRRRVLNASKRSK